MKMFTVMMFNVNDNADEVYGDGDCHENGFHVGNVLLLPHTLHSDGPTCLITIV